MAKGEEQLSGSRTGRPKNPSDFVRLRVLAPVMAVLAASLPVQAQQLPVCPDVAFEDMLTEQETARFASLEDAPYATGRYFEVDFDGARSTILGTFHFPMTGNVLPPDMLTRVEAARVVILETTPDQANELLADVPALMQAVLNPAGPYLLPEFTAEEWSRITAAVSVHGVPRFFINQLEPWVVSLAVAIPPCDLPTTEASDFGLDMQIFFHARDRNIPLRTLDSIAQITALVSGFGDATEEGFNDQIGYVRQTLQHQEFAHAYLNSQRVTYVEKRIMAFWAGAVVMMERLYGEQDGAAIAGRVWEDLIAGRNRLWMDLLLEELRQGGAVVAVGALHLPSEDGILRLLEREGFTVRAIPE